MIKDDQIVIVVDNAEFAADAPVVGFQVIFAVNVQTCISAGGDNRINIVNVQHNG